jgi:hypothetical protein
MDATGSGEERRGAWWKGKRMTRGRQCFGEEGARGGKHGQGVYVQMSMEGPLWRKAESDGSATRPLPRGYAELPHSAYDTVIECASAAATPEK